jgi:hypothetical protein
MLLVVKLALKRALRAAMGEGLVMIHSGQRCSRKSQAALPPDVRKRYALPSDLHKKFRAAP